MTKDRERAIDTLQRLYDYTRIEYEIASRQSEQARDVKDFRAMDRHASYASAMQKIQQRVNGYARNLYMHDVTTAKECGENARLNNEACDSERKWVE